MIAQSGPATHIFSVTYSYKNYETKGKLSFDGRIAAAAIFRPCSAIFAGFDGSEEGIEISLAFLLKGIFLAAMDEKVALITGASRGIGLAIAAELGLQGMKIICVSRSETSLAPALEGLSRRGIGAVGYAVDVSDGQAIRSAAERIQENFPTIQILVNNAGINRDNLLLRMTTADWDEVIRTDLTAAFHWTQVLSKGMLKSRWGRIVNISSVIGLIGNAGQANYAAAKAGLIGFTRSIAREFAGRNITANAIAPGFIETAMTDRLPEKVVEQIRGQVPMGRFGRPEDVAAAVRFLVSDAANYITGQVMAVDGGLAM